MQVLWITLGFLAYEITCSTITKLNENVEQSWRLKSKQTIQEPSPCLERENSLTCFNKTALGLCSSGQFKIINCHGPNPSCDPDRNVCMSLSSRAAEPQDEKKKLNNGYYPHPTSCSKYRFYVDGKPSEFSCDTGEVYDPKIKSCATRLGRLCYRFRCSGKQGRFTPYPGEPNIYALCSDNQPTELYRCGDGKAMDETEQSCKTSCEKEGMMPYKNSCMKFYECSRRLLSYKMKLRECPKGSWFDPKISQCNIISEDTDCPEAIEESNETETPATTQKPTSSTESEESEGNDN